MESTTQRARMKEALGTKLTLAVLVALTLSACGGNSTSTTDPTTSSDATDATVTPETTSSEPSPTSTETPATATSEGSDPDEPAASSGCTVESPESCGGSATLVIGGETIEFDFFACYEGDDAVAVSGPGVEPFFVGFGTASRDGVTTAVLVRGEDFGGIRYSVGWVPDVASQVAWWDDSDSMPAVDGGHVSYEGEFGETQEDGRSPTGRTDSGSFDGMCRL